MEKQINTKSKAWHVLREAGATSADSIDRALTSQRRA